MAQPTLHPIVLLEENPDDLYLLTRKLEASGAKNPVASFYDGEDAIAYFQRAVTEHKLDLPCLFFADLKTAGVDGLTVIERVRQLEGLRQMKIFVLTGSENPAHRARAIGLGVDGYLLKYPAQEVFSRIVASANC